jgi:hypothetical protein
MAEISETKELNIKKTTISWEDVSLEGRNIPYPITNG